MGKPLPTFPGASNGLTLTSPNHKLPLSLPHPKGLYSKQVIVGTDIQCGGLNRELVSGNGAPPSGLPTPSPGEAHARSLGPRPSRSWGGGGWRRDTAPLWMEARPGMRLTLKSGSIRRIGGCGVYKNLGGLGLDERDDLLGEGQVLLG